MILGFGNVIIHRLTSKASAGVSPGAWTMDLCHGPLPALSIGPRPLHSGDASSVQAQCLSISTTTGGKATMERFGNNRKEIKRDDSIKCNALTRFRT